MIIVAIAMNSRWKPSPVNIDATPDDTAPEETTPAAPVALQKTQDARAV